MKNIHQWIVEHDDRFSFVFLYVAIAICLSVFVNLFWVAMLMSTHLAIEIWRHRVLQHPRPVLQSLWCVKLDIALLLFALVVALYSHKIFAVLGLGGAARAGQAAKGVKLLTRFGIIERAVKVFFLTVDDMSRVVHMTAKTLMKRKKSGQAAKDPLHIEEHAQQEAEEEGLTKGDLFSIGFGVLCLGLLIAAPYLLDTSFRDVSATLLQTLHPLNH